MSLMNRLILIVLVLMFGVPYVISGDVDASAQALLTEGQALPRPIVARAVSLRSAQVAAGAALLHQQVARDLKPQAQRLRHAGKIDAVPAGPRRARHLLIERLAAGGAVATGWLPGASGGASFSIAAASGDETSGWAAPAARHGSMPLDRRELLPGPWLSRSRPCRRSSSARAKSPRTISSGWRCCHVGSICLRS